MTNPLSALTSWAVDVIEAFGYIGIFLMVALENLVPPIPSEVILPLAGFLIGQQRFSFLPVLIASTLGSMAGAMILYSIGRWFGEARLRVFARKYGKYLLLDEDDLTQSQRWFMRHGSSAMFAGRLVPGIRSLISIPAGIVEMPIQKFILFTTLGSSVWNGALIGTGWALGHQWERVENYTGYLEYLVIIAGICAVATFVWRRRARIFG